MTLEEAFFVSQTVVAVAVVAYIIYLEREVRQTECGQRANMQQGRADHVSKAAATIEHPESTSIWMKGIGAEPDITREELTQWLLLCRSLFLSGEGSLLRYKAGLLDQAAFETYVAGTRYSRYYLTAPGMRTTWKLTSVQLDSDFRAFVDDLIAKTPFATSTDMIAAWKEKLRVEIQRQPS